MPQDVVAAIREIHDGVEFFGFSTRAEFEFLPIPTRPGRIFHDELTERDLGFERLSTLKEKNSDLPAGTCFFKLYEIIP